MPFPLASPGWSLSSSILREISKEQVVLRRRAREGEAWPGTGAGWELPPWELVMTGPSVRGGRPLCSTDASARGDSEALVPSQHWTRLWGHVGRLGCVPALLVEDLLGKECHLMNPPGRPLPGFMFSASLDLKEGGRG